MSSVNEPLFSCSQDGCREECSYPADMLALHNGAPICEDCYHDLPFKSQAPDPNDEEETLIWHDLPRFVPSFVHRIEALEAEVERLRDVIDVIWVEASTMRNVRKLIGPYPTQPEKNRIWARSVCHIGKRLMEIIQPIRAKLAEKQ